ncbi:DBF4B protein, partial [Polypterus senegalus]
MYYYYYETQEEVLTLAICIEEEEEEEEWSGQFTTSLPAQPHCLSGTATVHPLKVQTTLTEQLWTGEKAESRVSELWPEFAEVDMKQTPVKDLEAPLPLSRQVFAGRSFYLDVPKSKHLTLVVEAIGKMGGTIESFLSKEVSYLVTASREACQGRVTKRNEKCRGVGSVNSSSQTSKRSVQSAGSQKPADSVR